MEKLSRFLNEALTYWLLACSIGTTLVPGKRMLFLFICLFPDNFLRHHIFCESQVFEADDVDRALGESKEFISTEKSFCISSSEIPEYFSIALLLLAFYVSLLEKTDLPFI